MNDYLYMISLIKTYIFRQNFPLFLASRYQGCVSEFDWFPLIANISIFKSGIKSNLV